MLDWKFLLGRRLPKGRRRNHRIEGSLHRRLTSEALEDRRMLATITVDTDISSTDGDVSSIANLIATPGADGNISLQEAIQAANNTPNSPVGVPDVIEFAIPGAGPHVIDLSGPLAGLNTITDAVIIDGYSQAGASANTADIGSSINASLQIVLDGGGALTGAITITETGGGTTIRGLNIRDFIGTAVSISSSDSNVVAGNFIGTNIAGTAADGNLTGVSITGDANGNVIGGTANADRNLISGNISSGVLVSNGATMNTILGNFIGMQIDGFSSLANVGQGIFVNDTANGNTIGGLTTEARNLISGNGTGIRLNSVTNTSVVGNFIGLNRLGTGDEGNTEDGIRLEDGATSNIIGGTTTAARNIISGNDRHGVFISGDSTSNNTVSGNYIGTDAAGTGFVGNSVDGVLINGGDNNTIGGTTSGSGNLISANVENGVHIVANVIEFQSATGNLVQGNLIGTDVNGTSAIGNLLDGVVIDQASNNTIGGTTAGSRNVISANGDEGVEISGSNATGNVVQGNFIGTQSDGTSALGNSFDGVEIVDGSNNTIGGTIAGAGNTIAFNGSEGVEVAGTPATGNAIRQNSIFNNGGAASLGIDLSANASEEDGLTPNDFGATADDDEGANRLQNFPVFVGNATLLGNSIAFRYRVPTNTANATYPLTVEFFIADSNNQEGQTFLASDTYTAAEAETTKFVIVPAPPALTNNSFVATATDAAGNTSEFSAPVQIALPTILGSEPTLIRPNEFINIDQINRYQYISHSTGKTVFRIDFLHALGDLALEIRDENGNLLDSSDTSSFDQNFEEVVIPTVGQEPYFINVIAVNFTDDIGQNYALEVENFPAPVPTGVHLDPNSDSGMMNNDGITNDTTPTFFIQTDVLNFVDTNFDGVYSDPDLVGPPLFPFDALHALTADEANLILAGTPEANDEDGGIAVEVRFTNTTTNQVFTFFADPLNDIVPEVYTLTIPEFAALTEGTYLISARTIVFDGQGNENMDPAQAMGRSNASPPLWITIDTSGPRAGTFDIISSSDSGMFDFDNVTNINQPAFLGLRAEPNAKVTVLAQRIDPNTGVPGIIEIVGTGTVNSFGQWEVTVEPLIDGKYNFFYALEDLAGNSSGAEGQIANVSNGTVQAIGNPGTINSEIIITEAEFASLVGDVAMDNLILDVNVTINIDHGNTEDLDVVLIAPNSTEIDLTSDNGGFGDNYTTTIFDDAAGTSIVDGTAPFTGRFSPEQALSVLNNQSPFGTWTLRVTDDNGNDIAGQLNSWTLDIHIPLMVVIDTEAPNTPFLDLAFETKGVTSNNMPTVTMTTHDPGVEFVNLLWRDNLKFRIYDRFENTPEFLLYDSALDTDVDNINSPGDMFTALTLITEMLPEQFFNQVGTNDAVVDVNGVGKLADGMHNLKLEVEDRAGNISEDFLLKLTVDTRPQLGAWAAGSVLIDSVDEKYGGHDAHDVTYRIGTDLDYIFAGEFLSTQRGILVGDDSVFVVDVSGSTDAAFGGDPVGDLNSDGMSDTVLDAEIAAFIALNQQLVDRGLGNTAQVAIVSFNSSATSLDMDPVAGGIQLTTTPLADADMNGIRDVDQVLRSLNFGGGTSYEAPLSTASSTVTSIGSAGTNVVFLSDGSPNALGAHVDEVATLQGQGVNLRAFGVGPGASLPELQIIDPTAVRFSNTNELLAAFGGGGGVGGVGQAVLGYDTLAAYGRIFQGGGFQYRWLVDNNGNGYIDPATEIFFEPAGLGFNGYPVAGNFDGDATNGDEVGLFTGTQWYLDTDGDFNVTDEAPINAQYTGFPIAGDFDGDGTDDLGTYIATSGGGNLFSIDTNRDGIADFSFHMGPSFVAGIGFAGTRERPIADDFNGDGIDDIGLWVPDGINPVPNELSEWFILVSGDDPSTLGEVEVTVLDRILGGNLNGFVPFSPGPVGNDIYAQFGNTFSLPVVGQFPPPGVLTFLVDGLPPNGDNGVVEVLEVIDPPVAVVALASQEIETEPQPPQPPIPTQPSSQPPVELVTQLQEPVEPPAVPPVALATVETSPAEPSPEPKAAAFQQVSPTVPQADSASTDPVVEDSEAVAEAEPIDTPAPTVPAIEEKPAVAATKQAEPAAEPVAPIESTPQPRKRTRSRSRSLSFGGLLRPRQTSVAMVQETSIKPAPSAVVATKQAPTLAEEPNSATAVTPAVPESQVILEPQIELVEQPPAAEAPASVVIVPQPTPEPATTASPSPEEIDLVLENVTSLELAKPELEPEPEIVLQQAASWAANQAETASQRRSRSRSLANFFWLN